MKLLNSDNVAEALWVKLHLQMVSFIMTTLNLPLSELLKKKKSGGAGGEKSWFWVKGQILAPFSAARTDAIESGAFISDGSSGRSYLQQTDCERTTWHMINDSFIWRRYIRTRTHSIKPSCRRRPDSAISRFPFSFNNKQSLVMWASGRSNTQQPHWKELVIKRRGNKKKQAYNNIS